MYTRPRNTENNAVEQSPNSVEGTVTNVGIGCIHHLFEEQVRERPDAVAVEYDGSSLTYSELNRRANQLAHALVHLGVRPNDIVGLCVQRSVDLIIGILGILKAGGAYLPLDPEYPTERLAFMLAEASAPVLVTQRALSSQISSQNGITLYVDEQVVVSPLSAEFAGSPPNRSCSTDLAYVIFTSGSTGKPKGTLITHHNVVRLFAATNHWFGFTAHDVWTLFHSFAFDFSVWEIWGALLYGGKLIIVPEVMRRSPEAFYRLLADHRVTVLNQTPSVFRQLIHAEESTGQRPLSLRFVIFGGEALQVEMLRSWWERHGDETPQVVNMYGITETTVHVTYRPLCSADLGGGSVIGRAIPDLEVHLLDADGKPIADGMAGEMFIAGAGLAKGYLQRPDLTAQRFVADHISGRPNARLYRTGDLARRLPCGDLEYLGRIDQQVKIRGFRIELGEIESTLERHADVATSAVVAEADVRGDQQLVAYLVLRDSATVSVRTLREWLGRSMPDYMIPARFVALEALPLTPNGKVDRRALAACQAQTLDSGTAFCPPQTPLESQLAHIWQKVLRLECVSVDDNFFLLGGHSLLAQTVVADIRSECGMEVPLTWVFQHPTIRGLAAKLVDAPVAASKLDTIELIDRSQPLPMSFGQQRMWILQQTLPNPVAYNVPVVHRITGPVNTDLLHICLRALAERHEALRTALIQVGDSLRQRIVATESLVLPWREADWRALTDEACEAALREEVRRPFDLKQAPLWRALWAESGPDEHLLALTFHHSIVDEWSLRLFFRELELVYSAGGDAEKAGLAALPAQYADYSAWQRQRLTDGRRQRDATYWAEQLANSPPPLPLPADSSRPDQDTHQGAMHRFALPQEVVDELRRLARAEGVSLFTLMLAAFQVWLYRYTCQDDVIVATPFAARDRDELQGVIGHFLNTLPIRTRLAGQASFCETLAQIRQNVMSGIEHSGLPFEEIVALAASTGDRSRTPLHQVMFVLLEEGIGSWRLGDAATAVVNVHTGTCKCDLLLSIVPEGDQWICELEYAADFLTTGSAMRMATHWQELLRAIATDPKTEIDRLNLLSDFERQLLTVTWNDTRRDYPRDACVHHLFEEQAGRDPNAVALSDGTKHLTYSELNCRANRLAAYLIHIGVAKGATVAVLLNRSIEYVISILAILKCGSAYVPLPVDYPITRLRHMLDDSQARIVVTSDSLPEKLACDDHTLLDLTALSREIEAYPAFNPNLECTSEHLAYIMYTSGSTGIPKGVAIPHRGIVRLVRNQSYAAFDGQQRFLHMAPTAFDASTFEIWGPLLNGSTCVVFTGDPLDFDDLEQIVRSQGITCVWLTASLFNKIVDLRPTVLKTLRQVIAGGEPLSVRHVLTAQQTFPHLQLTNGYGPTETTTFACTFSIMADNVTSNGSIPIGHPISNTTCYVLDRRNAPVPVGVSGELYIGGDGLAIGYWRQPVVTSERFVAVENAYLNEPRLYRTGDIVRRRTDGALEFVERRDQQVKIRGFRIELGEIETTLALHPLVNACAVTTHSNHEGDNWLTAHVVHVGDTLLSLQTMRQWIGRTLPEFMIPSRLVVLEQLPLDVNGKLDRKQLSLHVANCEQLEPPAIELLTPSQMQLVEICRAVLRTPTAGLDSDFRELGGNSLLAVNMVERIRQTFDILLPVTTVYRASSLRELDAIIQGKRINLYSDSVDEPFNDADCSPLFLIDLHIDDLELGDERLRTYTIPLPAFHDNPDRCSVEFIAEECLRILRTVQRRGPYYLAGFSLGGLIAFEMARQLRADGESVPLIAIIDTTPAPLRRRVARAMTSVVAAIFGMRFDSQMRLFEGMARPYVYFKYFLPDRARKLIRTPLAWFRGLTLKQPTHVGDQSQVDCQTKQEPHSGQMTRVPKKFTTMMWAHTGYKPQRYEGRVALFYTKSLIAQAGHPEANWKRWTRDLTLYEIPGTHLSCLKQHRTEFMTHFSQCLKYVRQERIGPTAVEAGMRADSAGPVAYDNRK